MVGFSNSNKHFPSIAWKQRSRQNVEDTIRIQTNPLQHIFSIRSNYSKPLTEQLQKAISSMKFGSAFLEIFKCYLTRMKYSLNTPSNAFNKISSTKIVVIDARRNRKRKPLINATEMRRTLEDFGIPRNRRAGKGNGAKIRKAARKTEM